jgi:hypothetical protein
MSSIRAIRTLSTITIVCITLQAPLLFGQGVSVPDSVTFSVGVAPPSAAMDSLDHEVIWTLYDILTKKGAVDTHTPDWLFVVGTKELSQGTDERVVVSIMTLHVLPKEAIEAGKREEVFYSNLSAEKKAALPKEGKWVRELVSEEMLHQFGMPLDQDIIVCKRHTLQEELSQFVDSFYLQYAHQKH